jgi:hypothetical protein
VALNVGNNLDATGATIAGGSVTQTTSTTNSSTTNNRNVHRGGFHVRFGLGAAALVILVGGVYGIGKAISSSDITQQAGLSGATGTLQQIRQAELDENPSTYCRLASQNNSNACRSFMSASFATTSATVKAQLPSVAFGAGSGSSETVGFPVLVGTRQIGRIDMEWTGSRWQLEAGEYDMLLLDGGLLHGAVEAVDGTGSFGTGSSGSSGPFGTSG